jgi:hypothetical protein
MSEDFDHFHNRQAQIASVLAFGGFGLLGLAGVFGGGSPGVVVTMLVLGFGFALRGAVAASIHVGQFGVVLVGIFRTRTFLWSDIQSVEVGHGNTGMNSGNREFVVFVRLDGTVFAFKEMNARPAGERRSNSEVWRACSAAQRQQAIFRERQI